MDDDDLDLDIKINAAGNSYVTGWVTVVEVLTPDGDKALITDDPRQHDLMGHPRIPAARHGQPRRLGR